MKVVVESNQVEIAFEALQSPLEEILFGAAPLKAEAGGIRDAQRPPVLPPRAEREAGQNALNQLVCGWLTRERNKQQSSLRHTFFFFYAADFGGKGAEMVFKLPIFFHIHANFTKLFGKKPLPNEKWGRKTYKT